MDASRRDFFKKAALGAVAVAGTAGLVQEDTALLAQAPSVSPNRHAIISALGDTLIPSSAEDPGYKNLEWYGITDEMLKALSNVSDSTLESFAQSSEQFFDGKGFLELDENQRADYLKIVIDGSKFQDKALLKSVQDLYRSVRRRVFTLYYQNFPENKVPRDIHDIPLLKPGDKHQDTNPNTTQLTTGWDTCGFKGALSWEEEEQRRKYFQQIDWVKEGSTSAQPSAKNEFTTQEDFTRAYLNAGSKGDTTVNYDVIIVGAGLAGCILAARIAEKGVNPKNGERLKIALVEWGPYFKGPSNPGYGHPLRRLLFTNVRNEFRMGGRYANPWAFGKLVGGSSMHFGAQAFHPLDVDLAHWRNETGVDWTDEELREAIKEVDLMFNVHPMPEALLTPGQKLFEKAAKKLGYSPSRLAHARKNCIHCEIGCDAGQMCKYDSKMSTLVNYVPIAEQEGVEIIPNTKVEKVVIEKRGSDFVATGIWAEQEGKKVQFRADKVILAASVNANPMILYNSGYGPRDVVGKDLIIENPNVGKHVDGKLSFRGGTAALFSFPVKDGSVGMPSAYYFLQGGDREGYDSVLIKENVSDTEYPDELALREFAPEFGWEHKRFMKAKGDQIAGDIGVQYLPRIGLEGHIERNGMHMFSVSNPQYAKRLVDGIAIVRDLYREMGATRITDIDRQIKQLQTGEFRGTWAGASQSPLPTTHQSCSCRSGADRSISVVNPNFECHDVNNLLICDLSAPPRVTYGNPGICLTAHLACIGWRRIVKNHFSRA